MPDTIEPTGPGASERLEYTMNTTSHKTIWRIAAVFAVVAAIAVFVRSRPADSGFVPPAPSDEAVAARDAQIEDLMILLQTDWRVRRQPTRDAVQQVAAYAQHPTLANAEAYLALSLFRYYGERDIDGALMAIDEAIELDPDWAWSHCLRGVLLFQADDIVESLRSFHRAMFLDPASSRPYSDLAIQFRIEEQWDLALQYAQRAIQLEPENPIPYYNYGVILDFQGFHDKADTYYRKVLEMNAALPAPYYNIACGFAREGNVESALQYLEIAIDLDPAFRDEVRNDPDFDPVRDSVEFQDFLRRFGA